MTVIKDGNEGGSEEAAVYVEGTGLEGVLNSALEELGEEGEELGTGFAVGAEGDEDEDKDKGDDKDKGKSKEGDEDEEDSDEDSDDDSDGDGSEEGGDDDGEEDGEEVEDDKSKKKEKETPSSKPGVPSVDDKLPEIPDEPEKPELKKVTVKSSKGEEFEISSAKDLPDDFEPYTYKAYGEALEELADNKAEFSKAMGEYESAVEKRESIVLSHNMKKGWDSEIEELVKTGFLSDDESEKRTVTSKVFEYMISETAKGNKNMSFTAAYKSWKLDNLEEERKKESDKAAKEAAEKKKNAEKKRRGGLVSGNRGGKSAEKESSRDTMPSGLTISQVEARLLRGLK